MPKTIEIQAYSLKELLEDENLSGAAEKAKEWLCNCVTEDGWWHEHVIEEWVEQLAMFGFTDAMVYFSGFWSQGDGACFDARCDTDRLIDLFSGRLPRDETMLRIITDINGIPTSSRFDSLHTIVDDIELYVGNYSGNYSHERMRFIEANIRGEDLSPQLERLFNEFKESVEELRLDLCRQIYKELEDEYDHQTSDEVILENAEANEYRFDEDGDLV